MLNSWPTTCAQGPEHDTPHRAPPYHPRLCQARRRPCRTRNTSVSGSSGTWAACSPPAPPRPTHRLVHEADLPFLCPNHTVTVLLMEEFARCGRGIVRSSARAAHLLRVGHACRARWCLITATPARAPKESAPSPPPAPTHTDTHTHTHTHTCVCAHSCTLIPSRHRALQAKKLCEDCSGEVPDTSVRLPEGGRIPSGSVSFLDPLWFHCAFVI